MVYYLGLVEDVKGGAVVLRGCDVDLDSPRWKCLDCEKTWEKLREVLE
jgi:hypothetical protein